MKNNRNIFFYWQVLLVVSLSSFLLSQQDTIKIACIGNSITEGNAMSSKLLDAYPVALGRYLGAGYNVKNFGVSGRTMLKKGDFPIWNEPLFAQALAFNPNIVTIMLGTNDSKPQNWVYKNEFITDYLAMIDTFKQLPSQPQIYVCLPLPAFSGAYDIRDSIIVTDIIPMIHQIAESAKVNIIDMNTPFLDKSSLMPDGIHPLVVGTDLIARILYRELTGSDIDSVQEHNVALYTHAVQGNNTLTELTDGNVATGVNFSAGSESVVITLADTAEIDMVQLVFTDSAWMNFSFSIALSKDSTSWTTVVDTALVDTLLLREKKHLKYIGIFSPEQAKFVKLLVHIGIPLGEPIVPINEIRIFETRLVHAPVLGWRVVSELSKSLSIQVFAKRTSNKGEYLKIYRQTKEGDPFILLYNYGYTIPANIASTVTYGTTAKYYCQAYFNGVEITSDTLVIAGEKTTGVGSNNLERPLPEYPALLQNYPNPFNPSTVIAYWLPSQSKVTLRVFDVLGREVMTLVNRVEQAGYHTVKLNAFELTGGIYFYRLQTNGGFMETKKFLLLR